MQKLIIHLRSCGIEHIVTDTASATDDLAVLAQNRQVIVLVPSEDVMLTTVKLPKMKRARLLQALPFSLEEQVIGDLNVLHFVPGEAGDDDNIPVAIVAKEKMQAWLDQLQALNIQPDILMPLMFALPLQENAWTISVHQMADIRLHADQGFACDSHNLPQLLDIALQAAQKKPECIYIRNYTSDALAFNLPVKVQEDFHDEKQFMTDLAMRALKSPHLNLLHGAYKARKSVFPEMRKSRNAAIMLSVACLALLFLYPAISYLLLKHKEHEIDMQIAEIYKHYFPQASNMVAPKIRMQEKMQQYTAQAGDANFLTLTAYIGKGMRAAHGLNLKRLSFQHQQMTLELSAASSENFSAFTDYLMRAGLKVKQESINLADTRVNAVITVVKS